MSAEITAADVLLGPIALFINLIEHGFPPDSMAGLKELIASSVGTIIWAAGGGAVAQMFG